MSDRHIGDIIFPSTLQVKKQEMLDPRMGVATKSELYLKSTFPHDGDTIYMKEGMLVSVAEEQSVYMLTDLTKIGSNEGWKRVDVGAAQQLEIVDNLTSEDSTKALSAKQGKLLKGEIDTIAAKVTSIYTPKGSKDTFEELPTDANVGDVYNVVAAYGNNPAGTNYAWNGTEWDALGGTVDLSAYSTTEQVAGLIKVETDRATAEEGRLAELIAGNTTLAQQAKDLASDNKTQLDSITQSLGEFNLILNGNDNPDDDIEDQVGVIERLAIVEEKNIAQDTRLTNLEKLVSGGEAGEGGATLLEMVNANTASIASLELRVKSNEDAIASIDTRVTTLEGAYEAAADALESLDERVSNVEKEIDTLNGTAEVEGSVDFKVAQSEIRSNSYADSAIISALSWIDVE